jgi:hypothetical protein
MQLVSESYRKQLACHKYRLRAIAQSVPENLANQACQIWYAGCQTEKDIQTLDKVTQYLPNPDAI